MKNDFPKLFRLLQVVLDDIFFFLLLRHLKVKCSVTAKTTMFSDKEDEPTFTQYLGIQFRSHFHSLGKRDTGP